jgi:hypothetical protein
LLAVTCRRPHVCRREARCTRPPLSEIPLALLDET